MAAQVREWRAAMEEWVTVERPIIPNLPAGISVYPPGCGVFNSAEYNRLHVRVTLARRMPRLAELLADLYEEL